MPGMVCLVLGNIWSKPWIQAKFPCLFGKFFQIGGFSSEFNSTVIIVLIGFVAGKNVS